MHSGCRSKVSLTLSSIVRTDPTLACQIDRISSTSTMTAWTSRSDSSSHRLLSWSQHRRFPALRPTVNQRPDFKSSRGFDRIRPSLPDFYSAANVCSQRTDAVSQSLGLLPVTRRISRLKLDFVLKPEVSIAVVTFSPCFKTACAAAIRALFT